jgi:hypothetical protein
MVEGKGCSPVGGHDQRLAFSWLKRVGARTVWPELGTWFKPACTD